jgi:hypothetical protein
VQNTHCIAVNPLGLSHATDYATSISKKYNAELYALNVIRADVDFVGLHEKGFMTRMRNEGEEYLNKVKVKAKRVRQSRNNPKSPLFVGLGRRNMARQLT